MKYPVCCVRDKLSGYDCNFAVSLNIEAAKRMFEFGCSQKGIQNFKPSDFEFYHVADFDSESGQMFPVYPCEYLCSGKDFV